MDNDPFEIPDFLRISAKDRKRSWREYDKLHSKDPLVTSSEREFNPHWKEQKERKKEKSRVRVEKMLAKKSGETAKMPLMGREALAHIRKKKKK